MINLKSKPTPKKGQNAAQSLAAPAYDEPAYPYGLTLRMNTEVLDKLGIKDLPKVGTKVRIVAMAEVSSVGQHQERDGDDNRHVELQITDMEAPAAKGAMYDKSDMQP
jgi:hypothetical protein